MKYIFKIKALILLLVVFSACDRNILEPQPVASLTNALVLNEAKDVETVRLGLLNRFRGVQAQRIIAGDFTPDLLVHNGTFTQYRELGVPAGGTVSMNITSSNASAQSLWNSLYQAVYMANFIIENIETVEGVPQEEITENLAVARFVRGYSYYVLLTTFGNVPLAVSTSLDENSTLPRAAESDIVNLITEDYNFALANAPENVADSQDVSRWAVKAAAVHFYLFTANFVEAENVATDIIDNGPFSLETSYATLVSTELGNEAILEVGYTLNDDPGTSTTQGLNNLFVGRREIIPSQRCADLLSSVESGDRAASATFSAALASGNDNGWTAAKYGTPQQNNNNITVFRLGEVYLLRAEARLEQGKLTGAGSAEEDINALRTRANASAFDGVGLSTADFTTALVEEYVYELAFEGHRWYVLKRLGLLDATMNSFSTNWRTEYSLWPIPLREIQNNSSLQGQQNPGY